MRSDSDDNAPLSMRQLASDGSPRGASYLLSSDGSTTSTHAPATIADWLLASVALRHPRSPSEPRRWSGHNHVMRRDHIQGDVSRSAVLSSVQNLQFKRKIYHSIKYKTIRGTQGTQQCIAVHCTDLSQSRDDSVVCSLPLVVRVEQEGVGTSAPRVLVRHPPDLSSMID